MQKTYFILLVGFYFAFLNSSAQDNYKNFVGIESAVLNVPLKISQDIDSLSFYLTAGYNTELKKAQSVFRWITNNINYDVNKQVTVFKNENDFSQDALRVLRSKKAVCEGYSNLFMELCRRSGLSVEIITGYASAKGDNQTQPHAWNVIKINDEWKLVDATWAAGGIDERNSTYHKSFDPKYFCMNPDSFLRTHYPIDPMWQLIAHPVTYKEFREKVKSQKEFIFSFNDTIAMHSKLLESDSMHAAYSQSLRALEYNPDDFYVQTMLNNIVEIYETQKFDSATEQASESIELFNSVITIINDAKKKRNTKKLNDNEIIVTKNLLEAKQKMKSALEIYNVINFTSGVNKITLTENTSRAKKNLNQMAEIDRYLIRYYRTPPAKRISAL